MSGIPTIAAVAALGLVSGIIGGMFGIGGGLIMVPALVLFFGLDPKTAVGTSLLAQLLPVGLLGVREYWQRGQVAVSSGLWLAFGLLVGALIGAKLAGAMSQATMKRLYGIFLLVVGAYFLMAPQGVAPKPKAAPVPEVSGDQVQRPPDLSS